jgi:hypothetical protein
MTKRILVEHENPRVLAARVRDLEAAGFLVDTCPGPSAWPDKRCPLITDGRCEQAEQADVILAALPMDAIKVYIALRTHYDVPVVLSLSDAERSRFPVLDQIGPVVPRQLAGAELAAAVDALA